MPFQSPLRVLIIDQDIMGEGILDAEWKPGRFEVEVVKSGMEGVQATQTWGPDVIIINTLQPNENGWKLCHRLRQHSATPILVLSVISDPQSIARWLDAGADDFLSRPFSLEILTAHLQKLARRGSHLQTQPLSSPIH